MSATERQVLDALHAHYARSAGGNGPAWVVAEHVRNGAGFDANRTADLIAQHLWPSKGLHLHGIEVKVSRSDWLCELRDPTKADAFRLYMNRWWLAVPAGVDIVRGDLPPGWGAMVVNLDTGHVHTLRRAPALTPKPMPATMRAALMRATAKTADRHARRGADRPAVVG